MNREQIDAFYEGMKAGIRRFAWWRDGKEFVGCGLLTLKEALEEIEKMKSEALERIKKENALEPKPKNHGDSQPKEKCLRLLERMWRHWALQYEADETTVVEYRKDFETYLKIHKTIEETK